MRDDENPFDDDIIESSPSLSSAVCPSSGTDRGHSQPQLVQEDSSFSDKSTAHDFSEDFASSDDDEDPCSSDGEFVGKRRENEHQRSPATASGDDDSSAIQVSTRLSVEEQLIRKHALELLISPERETKKNVSDPNENDDQIDQRVKALNLLKKGGQKSSISRGYRKPMSEVVGEKIGSNDKHAISATSDHSMDRLVGNHIIQTHSIQSLRPQKAEPPASLKKDQGPIEFESPTPRASGSRKASTKATSSAVFVASNYQSALTQTPQKRKSDRPIPEDQQRQDFNKTLDYHVQLLRNSFGFHDSMEESIVSFGTGEKLSDDGEDGSILLDATPIMQPIQKVHPTSAFDINSKDIEAPPDLKAVQTESTEPHSPGSLVNVKVPPANSDTSNRDGIKSNENQQQDVPLWKRHKKGILVLLLATLVVAATAIVAIVAIGNDEGSSSSTASVTTRSDDKTDKLMGTLTPSESPVAEIITESPTFSPAVSLAEQNELLTCIAIVQEEHFDDSHLLPLLNELGTFRATFPDRRFCILRVVARGDQELPEVSIRFSEQDIVTRLVRDNGRFEGDDIFSLCGLTEQRQELGVNHVALHLHGDLDPVRNAFYHFQNRISETDYRVVRGELSSSRQVNWVTPCLTARVIDEKENSLSPCSQNSDCASFVCVGGRCQPSYQLVGEECDLNDVGVNSDCANQACGRLSLSAQEQSFTSVCCQSHELFEVDVSGSLESWCKDQPNGSQCYGEDEVCLSRFCDEENVCSIDTREPAGAECQPNEDSQCLNGACGHQSFEAGSPFVCCESGTTIFFTAFGETANWCSGLAAGFACGAQNDLCLATCVEGVCMDGLQQIGDRCDEDDSGDCANSSCGRESVAEDAPFICCESISRFAPFRVTDNFCNDQPVGASCAGQDNICASGVCIDDICQVGLRQKGETCGRNQDDHCVNGKSQSGFAKQKSYFSGFST